MKSMGSARPGPGCRLPRIVALGALLASVALAIETPPAETEWSEAWRDVDEGFGRRLALAAGHVRLESLELSSVRMRTRAGDWPIGARLALRGPRVDWLLAVDGRWTALDADGPCGSFQAGGKIVDALRVRERTDSAWLLEPERLLRVERDGERLALREAHSLAPLGGPAELRGSPEGDWLRRGGWLQRLDHDAARLPWPVDWQAWAVREGRPLGLASGRGLCDADGDCPLPGDWRRLVRAGKALWLEDAAGLWTRWPDHGDPEAPRRPPRSGEAGWLTGPVEAGWLAQSPTARELWKSRSGAWALADSWPRRQLLRDRQFRQACDWRLEGLGEVWRRDASGAILVETRSEALGWAFAGGGPLLAEENGLRAYSLGGSLLGQVERCGLRCWAALEDWLLTCDEDSLAVWWTGEEQPWRQGAIPLSGAVAIAAQGRWAVASAGQRLSLLDIAVPWQPELLDERVLPRPAIRLLVIEDRLLLVDGDGLRVFDLGDGRLETCHEAHVRPPAEGLARRGLDRLLLLEATGRLWQARLENGLPVRFDWSLELPHGGRMLPRGDSLWVIGDGAWTRLRLPPVARSLDVPALAADSDSPLAEGALAWPNPVRGRLSLARPAGWEGPVRVALYDLLGRRLESLQLPAGLPAPGLSLAGRPAGSYWLVWEAPERPPLARRVLCLP